LIEPIKEFQEKGEIPLGCNVSFVTLIPKSDNLKL